MKPAPSLTARSPIMGAGEPSAYPLTPDASVRKASGDPPGSPSTTYNQRCHDPENLQHSRAFEPGFFVIPPPIPEPHPGRTKVTGWGPRAQMLLVDALLGAGELEIAGEVAACGSILVIGAQHATVHTTGQQRRHMGHLAHCGRFQRCPVCTPFIMARRLEALEGVGQELAQDGSLRHFMVVLTIRHKRNAAWKVLVKALRKMQATVRRGHPWRNAVVGYVRLMESTYRHQNGHHPHEHLLVSMRDSEGFDAGEFFSWVKEVCKREARKARRSCDFQGDWWSEIPRERLAVALRYLGRADKVGTTDRNPLHEFSSSTKHQPIWCIPPYAFAEVWRDSYRMRWFDTGGRWNTQATAKTDEEVNQERETTGTVIAHIPRSVWLSWPPKLRREVRALVSDRALSDAEAVARIASLGGVAGPPPIPDWGDQAPTGTE